MNNKSFIKKIGLESWGKSHKEVYGLMEYDKNLVNLISLHTPEESDLLDIAIATGYPYAELISAQDKGYKLSGIDIVPELIDICKRDYPEVNSREGNVEAIPFSENSFYTSYCFNSTWYFPDLKKAISEMQRVTRNKGTIIFDSINLGNKKKANKFKERVFKNTKLGKIVLFLENIIRFILRKKYKSIEPIFENYLTADQVIKILGNLKITKYLIYGRIENGSLLLIKDLKMINQYERLIFVLEN